MAVIVDKEKASEEFVKFMKFLHECRADFIKKEDHWPANTLWLGPRYVELINLPSQYNPNFEPIKDCICRVGVSYFFVEEDKLVVGYTREGRETRSREYHYKG